MKAIIWLLVREEKKIPKEIYAPAIKILPNIDQQLLNYLDFQIIYSDPYRKSKNNRKCYKSPSSNKFT